MSTPSFSIPDPSRWLMAFAPSDKRDAVAAWKEWLSCLLWLTDEQWSERDRQQALFAVDAGRTPRIPCREHPGLTQLATVRAWYCWVSEPAPRRLETDCWMKHTIPWSRDVLSTLGLSGEWRQPQLDAVNHAVFLMMRLDLLHQMDIISLDHPLAVSATTAQERQKRVWRECVQIRQHLADLLPIARDLPRGGRGYFKYWWMASLEWTRLAERAGEDMWNRPVSFSWVSRAHISWQRWFGKLAFR